MRVSQLKTLIKETVREVFQEEIKGLLMEALTSKTLPSTSHPIQEAVSPTPPPPPPSPQMRDSFRQQYSQMMNGEMNLNTQNTQAQPAYRPISPQMTMGDNGSLPPGEVNLDQIAGIMTPKK